MVRCTSNLPEGNRTSGRHGMSVIAGRQGEGRNVSEKFMKREVLDDVQVHFPRIEDFVEGGQTNVQFHPEGGEVIRL